MRLLILLLALAPLLTAGERFSFGARVGVPLTDAFQSVEEGEFFLKSDTKHFTIGPSVELFLPFGLGLEADLLYKRTEVEVIEPQLAVRDTVGAWELPLLAKYRLPGIGLRPFVAGGGAYRNFGSLLDLAGSLKDSGWGLVVGAGLEIKVKRLRISPELRFTRWGSGETTDGDSQLRYSRNQADFLVGITF